MSLSEYWNSDFSCKRYSSTFFSRAIFSSVLLDFSFFLSSPFFLAPSARVGSSLIFSSCMRATHATTCSSLLHSPPDFPAAFNSALRAMMSFFNLSNSFLSSGLMPADSAFFLRFVVLLLIVFFIVFHFHWGRFCSFGGCFCDRKVSVWRWQIFRDFTRIHILGVCFHGGYFLPDCSSFLFVVFTSQSLLMVFFDFDRCLMLILESGGCFFVDDRLDCLFLKERKTLLRLLGGFSHTLDAIFVSHDRNVSKTERKGTPK